LSPLIRACDLMTIPSTVPEACPLTLLESMACGVPVVASDGPGVRSLLRGIEDGLLVQPGDPADLAEKIGSLLGDLGRRQQIAEWGRAMITADYGWDQKIKRLEAIYQEVLAVPAAQEGLV
jgi:glycosyltransferase involved in cell wall biosynthesis